MAVTAAGERRVLRADEAVGDSREVVGDGGWRVAAVGVGEAEAVGEGERGGATWLLLWLL